MQAALTIKVVTINGVKPTIGPEKVKIPVESAWVIVGYPRYAPQLLDIVTLDETIYDVALRDMAYDIDVYGVSPFDGNRKQPSTPVELAVWQAKAHWNTDYYPFFYRDIWPILRRPDGYKWVIEFDQFAGADPHRTTEGGNLDENVMSTPPHAGEAPDECKSNARMRNHIFDILRKAGQENLYTVVDEPNNTLIGMPDLCGDNPITNTLPSKFLRLTDTMLFLLQQWAAGKFINEKCENIVPPPARPGNPIDYGVLSNCLGGAFCPGAEVTWIIRNPAIYTEPFRIKMSTNTKAGQLSLSSDFSEGLEPGDVTKFNGVPWQSDFAECTTQEIDITYDLFNSINPRSVGDPTKPIVQSVFWWPTHRPMEVTSKNGQVKWSRGTGAANTPRADLEMVTAWKKLGFIFGTGIPLDFKEFERTLDKS